MLNVNELKQYINLLYFLSPQYTADLDFNKLKQT